MFNSKGRTLHGTAAIMTLNVIKEAGGDIFCTLYEFPNDLDISRQVSTLKKTTTLLSL